LSLKHAQPFDQLAGSSSRQKRMGLKFVSDLLGVDHAKLDKILMEELQEQSFIFNDKDSIYSIPYLLYKIVKNCSALDQRYSDFDHQRSLFSKYGETLTPLLSEAWRTRSFCKVRKLGQFRFLYNVNI
jgi:hypothetical protein